MSVLVALDLDGTLVDPRERQVRLTTAILAELGAQAVDPDELWAVKQEGAGTRSALMELGLPEDVAAEAQRLWVERVELHEWLSLDALLPGVAEAVETMRGDGASLFVLTARRDPSAAVWQVERLGLGLDDVEVVDPYHAAERKAEVLRSRGAAGMIGDTEADAAASAAVSIPFVAVSTGQRSAEFLHRAGINPIVADLGAAWAELQRRLQDRRLQQQ